MCSLSCNVLAFVLSCSKPWFNICTMGQKLELFLYLLFHWSVPHNYLPMRSHACLGICCTHELNISIIAPRPNVGYRFFYFMLPLDYVPKRFYILVGIPRAAYVYLCFPTKSWIPLLAFTGSAGYLARLIGIILYVRLHSIKRRFQAEGILHHKQSGDLTGHEVRYRISTWIESGVREINVKIEFSRTLIHWSSGVRCPS